MAMEESGERSDLRRMQREQERERRRIRDRQRRQSMTLEQRERHLARRRRNYQLRRLRAESSRLGSHCADPNIIADANEMAFNNEYDAIDSNPESGFHSDGVNPIGFIQAEEQNAQGLQSVGVEALAHNITSRLRLSHIRRLARSLNQSRGEALVTGNHQVVAEPMQRHQANTTGLQVGDCDLVRSTGGLRLNRVKRLARSQNTGTVQTNGQSHQRDKETMSDTLEQSLLQGDTQVINSDKSKLGRPTSGRVEDELPSVDG
ncbi:uncharacterized protein LOC107434846 [Ziziphus jujuba]|uniref:Uncharacterized protein LOC107434846 n=1 Tax=Ziziphus jujuba TaxID=326968 RepID=A0A6P4BFW6_ZIZJJ|nr:uncharacterized protein LOC107434846 [Ziziphus jujuba]XP_024923440.3 uncharacterized protein LOC107434846 [Ziziphus jujuba]